MAVENFTSGWTEADPDAKLSQTSTTASASTLNALSSNETHLYKDMGAGAYPADYGPFRFTAVATAQSSSSGRGCFFSISPILPDIASGAVVYEQSTRVWWNNGTLYLSHWQDGNNSSTVASSEDSTSVLAVALNTTFYCELQRTSGTVTCKVYSDSGYSTLVDTLSISPANTYSHRYVIVTAKQSSGSGATLTFDTSNLDLAPAASGLTITSVNTTNTAFSAQTNSAVVGTGLSASVVCTYAGIACTNESASSSTSLKITFPNFFTNNIKLGRNYEFKVVG